MKGWLKVLAGAAGLILVSPLLAPQLLAFPYKTKTTIGTVWSERRLDPDMLDRQVAIARERLATTPLASAQETRPIFVTDGGWRWAWLALQSRGGFALTRPLNTAVVVNDTDPVTGTIRNGSDPGGERRLGPVLAHEFTHGLIRRRFGVVRAGLFPTWKIEGYADHVAGESSLSEADVALLREEGRNHPALPYFHGRLRVAEILRDNGGDLDALFARDN